MLDALCLPHPLASFGWPRSLSLSPTVTGAVRFYLGFHSVLDLFPGPPVSLFISLPRVIYFRIPFYSAVFCMRASRSEHVRGCPGTPGGRPPGRTTHRLPLRLLFL